MEKKEKLAGAGMILSALLASVCCIGPVVFAILGIGAVGFSSALAPWRPFLIAITFAFLAVAFYFAYRKPRAGCEDGSCEQPETRKRNRWFLWAATVVVLFLILFPYLPFSSGRTQESPAVAATRVELMVEGMTCSSCDFAVETAVKKLPGVIKVHARHDSSNVTVVLDPSRVKATDVAKAINRLGYRAMLQAGGGRLEPGSNRKEEP